VIDWDGIAFERGYKNPVEMVDDLYWGRGMSLNEVSDELIVSRTALIKFMKENGIGARGRIEALKNGGLGPKCPSCGSGRSTVSSSWGMTERGYERERYCKDCGRYFRTVEIVGGASTARAGSCICSNCKSNMDVPFDVMLDTGTTFSCKRCGEDTVVVLMKTSEYTEWARRRRPPQ